MKFRASSNMPSKGCTPWSSCKYRCLHVVFPGLGSSRHLVRGRMKVLLFYHPDLPAYTGFIWKQLF